MSRVLRNLIILGLLFGGCRGTEEINNDVVITAEEFTSRFEAASLNRDTDVAYAIAHAAKAEKALVFVHVAYSSESSVGTRLYANWLASFFNKNLSTDVSFYYIDSTAITEPSSPYFCWQPYRELPGWDRISNRSSKNQICGTGDVFWLENGHVVDFEPFFYPNVVTRKTNEHFRR